MRWETPHLTRQCQGSALLATGAAAILLVMMLVLSACAAPGSNEPEADFPSRELTIIAGGGPGGGLDTVSRQLVDAMQSTGVEQRLTVVNNAAGNGNSARANVLSSPHNGYRVVIDSNRVILNTMMGNTELDFEEFAPLASLSTDHMVWVVPQNSPFRSARDVIEAVKKDTQSVTFGIGSIPSDEQLNILLPMKASGVKDLRSLNIVNFLDGGAVNTELLGGRIDVASTGYSEIAPMVESGDFRVLSVSGEEPLGDIPNWKSMGMDVVLSHWRGVFGPADMPENTKQWWIESMRRATESPQWKQQVENVGLIPEFVPGEEFRQQILHERETMAAIYKEVGIAND